MKKAVLSGVVALTILVSVPVFAKDATQDVNSVQAQAMARREKRNACREEFKKKNLDMSQYRTFMRSCTGVTSKGRATQNTNQAIQNTNQATQKTKKKWYDRFR